MFSCCFQCLFQSDQILYTIVPVTGKENLQQAYIENSEGVCTNFVLLNRLGLSSIIQMGYKYMYNAVKQKIAHRVFKYKRMCQIANTLVQRNFRTSTFCLF